MEQDILRESMGYGSWIDVCTLPIELRGDGNHFRDMWGLHPTTSTEVMIMGKLVAIPRYYQTYLRDHKFSGVELKSLPLPKILQPYLTWANSLGYGIFNQLSQGWYQDGMHYIGSHEDDEKHLKPASPIVTITLYQPSFAEKRGETTFRKFRIRDRKNIIKDIETSDGTVFIIGGNFQREFKHEIVKITGNKTNQTGPMISITLRQFI